MKKLILILLVALGGWNHYQKQSVAKPAATQAPIEQVIPDYSEPLNKAREVASSMQFRCDGRQHCSQMTSRAEAEFFLKNCPNTKMDGDHDGVPCERDSRW